MELIRILSPLPERSRTYLWDNFAREERETQFTFDLTLPISSKSSFLTAGGLYSAKLRTYVARIPRESRIFSSDQSSRFVSAAIAIKVFAAVNSRS